MKNIWISFLFIMSFASITIAQPIRSMTTAKKITIAEEKLAMGDYYNALEWYEKAYEDDSKNTTVVRKLAEVHYLLRDFKSAEKWYGKLKKRDKEGKYLDDRFIYARTLKMNGNYDDAIKEFNQFRELAGVSGKLKELAAAEILGCELAKELDDDDMVEIANLGANINSPFTEFGPALVSENEMYYASIRSDSIIVIENESSDHYAKMYRATKEGEAWGKGVPVAGDVNKFGFHTGQPTFSSDKNTMYFTRCVLEGNSVSGCNIYSAERDGDSWSNAIKLENVNGDYTSKQPAMGSVGGQEALFFVSNKAGGEGGWDIYYAVKQGAKFGAPVNIGSGVNTIGDEETPFHQDDALYFSSNGHPGIGGHDVFKSTMSDGAFSSIENMGKGVNSRVDDLYFTLGEDGYQGFIVSNRPGTISLKSETCCDDIFSVVLLREIPVDVMATTFDKKEKSALKGATVTLIPLNADGTRDAKTNVASNDFAWTLERERKYRLVATREGYYSDSLEITTMNLKEATTMEAELMLAKVPPPPPPPVMVDPPPVKPTRTIIALENIYYDFDRSNIRNDASLTLDGIIARMVENPDWVIEVASHTDSKGKNSYNTILSERRTKAAIKYMTKRGVDKSRFVPVHFGEDQPAVPNTNGDGTDSKENRQLNRRTEFRIITYSGSTSSQYSSSVVSTEKKK